jgi:hypothetical protein
MIKSSNETTNRNNRILGASSGLTCCELYRILWTKVVHQTLSSVLSTLPYGKGVDSILPCPCPMDGIHAMSIGNACILNKKKNRGKPTVFLIIRLTLSPHRMRELR